MRQFRVVAVNGIEAIFVLQTEHKYDRVHPHRELQQIKVQNDDEFTREFRNVNWLNWSLIR